MGAVWDLEKIQIFCAGICRRMEADENMRGHLWK